MLLPSPYTVSSQIIARTYTHARMVEIALATSFYSLECGYEANFSQLSSWRSLGGELKSWHQDTIVGNSTGFRF